MGIRDSINQRPRLVTVVTVAVIVLSLIAIVIQQWSLPTRAPVRGEPTYETPGGADRPVGDEQQQPAGRRPAAAAPRQPRARVPASPRPTLG